MAAYVVSRAKLGLLLDFLGMCLFAGTLPATQFGVAALDRLFLTATQKVDPERDEYR